MPQFLQREPTALKPEYNKPSICKLDHGKLLIASATPPIPFTRYTRQKQSSHNTEPYQDKWHFSADKVTAMLRLFVAPKVNLAQIYTTHGTSRIEI